MKNKTATMLALAVFLFPACRGFERSMSQRWEENRSPTEVYYENPREENSDKGEELGDELKRHNAVEAYAAANRAFNEGDLKLTRQLLLKTLQIDPSHAKARTRLTQIEKQMRASGQALMSDEEQIAQQKARVEIRLRMKSAASLLRRRKFRGANQEYQLALRSTNQLPDGLQRACLQFRIRALQQFARQLAAEAGYRING